MKESSDLEELSDYVIDFQKKVKRYHIEKMKMQNLDVGWVIGLEEISPLEFRLTGPQFYEVITPEYFESANIDKVFVSYEENVSLHYQTRKITMSESIDTKGLTLKEVNKAKLEAYERVKKQVKFLKKIEQDKLINGDD